VKKENFWHGGVGDCKKRKRGIRGELLKNKKPGGKKIYRIPANDLQQRLPNINPHKKKNKKKKNIDKKRRETFSKKEEVWSFGYSPNKN